MSVDMLNQITIADFKDYALARRRARLRSLLRILRRGRRVLLSLDQAREPGSAIESIRYGGLRTVPLSSIVGSVDRHTDFDPDFYPLAPVDASRWESVNRATLGGTSLPPVRLVKLGEQYFVEDGHHRVSVARYHGVENVDAEIVEYVAAPAAGGAAGAAARTVCACLAERPAVSGYVQGAGSAA